MYNTTSSYESILEQLGDSFDLTDPNHHMAVRAMAEKIMADCNSYTDVAEPRTSNVFEHLSHRLARARLYALSSKTPLKVSIVTNLLGENNRLRPSMPENPHGEDSLRRKVEEIEWLCRDTSWTADLLYVSGGDPWGSEEVWQHTAQSVRADHPSTTIRMVRTADFPDWKGRNTNDKGGEWNLGVRLSVNQTFGSYDYVYITDADTSFNIASSLGEALMNSLENTWDVVLADRKHPASILQKNAKRSGPGIVWHYYATRQLGRHFVDMGALDTQAPSKLYSTKAAQAVDAEVVDDSWAVDTDHYNALLANGFSLHFVPVVFVDSQAESVGFKLPIGHPHDTAYRFATILRDQIKQLQRYKDRIDMPHYDESLQVATIVNDKILGYNPDILWAGLSKVIATDVPQYSTYQMTDFTPQKISVSEFEAVIDSILADDTTAAR